VWQIETHPYHIKENTLKILKKYGVTDLII
jgi:histone acetyltransferase (RNA polymerase elongator complex component)